MAKTGKKQNNVGAEPFEFPLFVRKQHEARRRELAFADAETLRYEFQRLKDKIDWEALRLSETEKQVDAALSRLDEFDRNRLPDEVPRDRQPRDVLLHSFVPRRVDVPQRPEFANTLSQRSLP
jgi:hypothetical protein